MCLGVPGRIVSVWDESGTRMATALFDDQARKVCLAYLPDLAIGDWVITHMGYALTQIDEETALSTIATMREYGVLRPSDPLQPVSTD